jgi:hypothetical protein
MIVITVGAAIITGLAEDTFVSVEEVGDGVTSVSGADGEVARSMSADRRARLTLTLQQTSPSNNALSELLQIDRASGGNGVFSVSVTDLRGFSIMTSSEAWVVKAPTLEYAATVGTREWVIECASSIFFVGGNL